MKLISGLVLAGLLLLPGYAAAEDGKLAFGGDQYVAGQSASIAAPVERDAFAAGYDVLLNAPVTGDAHLAGFNVTSDAAITGDLYAAGSSVSVNGTVGGDITAFGSSVAVRSGATVTGNVRLAGATVTLSAPVNGSALITAQTLTLDTTVAGDLNFFGENLNFGPAAKVTGKVIIRAPKEIAVPATVAAADRVSYSPLAAPDYATEAGKTAEHVVQSIWPAVWATGLWWVLLVVIGLLFITLAPRLVAALEIVAAKRPFRNLGLGILAFASVVGLVPVFALTIVGLFLLPFVLVFEVVACALAYLAGTYLVGVRIAQALLPIDSNLKRVGVLVASIVLAGLIGMIPFVGWLVTLALLAFGFGAFAVRIMVRWTTGDVPRLSGIETPAGAD
ncbi:MAG: hypothetical protein EOP19_04605 [Hyphomicrobiales bacterium]|nr:MAG: hypothetical protein EOP19_04605 [Hyphomicrobiales bacterium]